MTLTSSELVSLVVGDLDVATAATRSGLSEAEVRRCQAAFSDGLRAATRASRSPRRTGRPLAVTLVLLAAGAAFAGLSTFAPNSPARADQVNANFSYLEGLVLGFPDGGVGTVKTGSLVSTGAINAASVTTGALNDTGTLSVGGTLSAVGDVTLGAAGKALSITGSVAALGAPVTLTAGSTLTATTDGFVVALLSATATNNCSVVEATGTAAGQLRGQASANNGCVGVDYPTPHASFAMPVRKGETYSVATSGTGATLTAFFMPLGR